MARMERLIFLVSAVLLLAVLFFLVGYHSYRNQNLAFRMLEGSGTAAEELLDPVGRARLRLGRAFEHLQPSRGPGEAVTVNLLPDDGAMVLMLGFFDGENQARLIRRDGSVVARWSFDYTEHYPDQLSAPCPEMNDPLQQDMHGAVLSAQGELVAIYEYCGMVKLDRCGHLVWALNHPAHHSVIRAEEGGYWVLGREVWQTEGQRGRFPPFSGPRVVQAINEDLLLRVSDDGTILQSTSIPALMSKLGLEAVLTASGTDFRVLGPARSELVHTNKIAELSTEMAGAFPLFAAGDLALSMRNLNLLLVVDAAATKIKWHQTGPWLRQHDPEFRPDGRISVFNNNVYRGAYDAYDHTRLDSPWMTNIMAVDPRTGATEILYGGREEQEMLSVVRGQHELLPDGSMLITEFDAGRVFEVDPAGRLVWEYINRYDEDFVGEVTNALLLPAGYFEVEMGVCS